MKKTRTHFLVLLWVPIMGLLGAVHAQDEVEKLFRDALYQEEVKGDPETALEAYREVTTHLDQHRGLAATALFRQAECLRKLKRLEEAAASYERVLTQYSDQERVARLSRENLQAMGKAIPQEALLSSAKDDVPAEEAAEIERLKEIFNNSPDLLNNSLDGAPPLHTAAEKGQLAVANYLIEVGARLDVVHQGRTPLHAAAQAGRKAMCELLIKHGADVNSDTGSTPLLLALKERREAVALLLLDKGAQPELGSVSGWTWNHESWNGNNIGPLHLAIANELSLNLVDRLIEAGADVNRLFSERWTNPSSDKLPSMTPLSFAIERGDAGMVNALLSAGADVVKFDEKLVPPLILALENIDMKEPEDPIVTALVDARADWKTTNEHGENTLHVAARQGLAKWLMKGIAAGVDPNHLDISQQTPLHKAAAVGHTDCLKILLEAGANPDEADDQGNTVLHYLASDRNAEGLELAIEAGADVNLRNNAGETALSLVAVKPKLRSEIEAGLRCLSVLLDEDPDPSVGSEGTTIYSYAIWGAPGKEWTENQIWLDAIRLMIDHEVEVKEQDLSFLKTLSIPTDRGASRRRVVQGGNSEPRSIRPMGEHLASSSEARDLMYKLWMTLIQQQHADRLEHAVWISQGESAIEHKVPVLFEAILSDEVLASPGSLTQILRMEYSARYSMSGRNSALLNADLRQILVRRGDEDIPVDYKQLLETETEFQLQWGDVVELPATSEANREPEENLKDLFQGVAPIDVRVQLGENQYLSNVEPGREFVYQVESDQVSVPSTLLQELGIESPWLKSWRVSRVLADGTLGWTTLETLRHGDLIFYELIQPKAQTTEEDTKKGIYFCRSSEGPFWPVVLDHYYVPHLDGSPVLELILTTPNGLPLYPIAWDQITVKQWNGDTWDESLLKDRDELVEPTQGTLLLLPEGSEDNLNPPEWLQNRVKEKLSFSWRLIIENNLPIFCKYTPPTYTLESLNGRLVWREPGTEAHRPVLPTIYGLPRAQEAGKGIDLQRVINPIVENSEDGEPVYILKIP